MLTEKIEAAKEEVREVVQATKKHIALYLGDYLAGAGAVAVLCKMAAGDPTGGATAVLLTLVVLCCIGIGRDVMIKMEQQVEQEARQQREVDEHERRIQKILKEMEEDS